MHIGAYRNGWGASAIDAFSTALIMGKTDVVEQILDYVPTIDFSVSYNDTVVSLFETTIRYLGGLLSGTNDNLILFLPPKRPIMGILLVKTIAKNQKQKGD